MTYIPILLFGLFFVFLFAGMPVGMAVAVSSLIVLVIENRFPLEIIPQTMFNAVDSNTLLALPFFMLAGTLMEKSGITNRLVDFAYALVGWVKGAMCHVSIFAGMMMGGVSGSAPSDAAALSSVMIPSMRKMGYPPAFAASIQAASGSIGIIIPPSLPMIILGSLTGISVGKLFLGGFLPGLLIGVSFMITCAIIVHRKGYGGDEVMKFHMGNVWRTFKRALLPLLSPVIIIGGILSGIFTATESSIIAVVYTLVLAVFVYRTIKIKDLPKVFLEPIGSAANVMLIIAASSLFSWILTINNFGVMVTDFFLSISENPIIILILINIIFFIGGMFLEGTALQLMFVPILYPIALGVGIDPVAFGVTIIMNIALGTITPPVGVCLFVASSIGRVEFEKVAVAAVPLAIALIINIFIVIAFPQIITFIPNTFMP